jgi:hypothetical protein
MSTFLLKPSEADNESFDTKFKPFFDKVAGSDGDLDAFELQIVMNSVFQKGMYMLWPDEGPSLVRKFAQYI